MCGPEIVLNKIVEKIVEVGIQSLGRPFGYLLHYKQNMKSLEDEMNELQERTGSIERQIDEARNRGEVIVDEVSDWRNGADKLRQGVERFIEIKTVKENVQCCKFLGPNFISRYGLSKEAKTKISDVKSLIEKVKFDRIAQPAPPPLELKLPSSGEFMSFDSRDPVFNKIMEALKDSSVEMIGVYGTGGVGKTTMVTKVGKQVEKDKLFDEVVMAVVSQHAKVAEIQEQLAARLDLKLGEESEVRRGIQLWTRLNNGKRNLVILDDVWEELNLKEIGIPIIDDKGCKVVLTSRNQRVFNNMVVYGDFKEVYRDFSIEVLSEDEAWNLFKKKMGNNVDPHQQLYDIAREVCRECGGLPVAILAVAAALKDQPMPAWRSSLIQLKESKLNNIEGNDSKLVNSLRLSYDYLKSKNAKSCFLLCCSFPEDTQISIEELAVHCMTRRLFHDQDPDTLEEARDSVCSVVNTLKTSCLLLDGENDDFVKMHDVIRDVAILIAIEEKAYMVKHGVKKWPGKKDYEKFPAISLTSETIHKLPNELVCQELHMLMLECRNGEIPDRFFSGTKELVVLELNRATVLSLPSSLGKLTELRMLCLNKCKLGDIATLKYLKNTLEILRLRGSNITALPLEVGELTCLRLLDLGYCDKLKEIPSGVISKLDHLEELRFPEGFDNWEATTNNEDDNWEGTTGNEGISKVSLDELKLLTRLSTLDIGGVPYFWQLPIDLCIQSLIRFKIRLRAQSCRNFKDCSSQGIMQIHGICSDDDFNCWKRLLGKPKWFNNLTQLFIVDCRLKYLFSPFSARELGQLQGLVIQGSDIMEAVIGNEGERGEEIIEDAINFSQLKRLFLGKLPHLISFYSPIKKATTDSHSFAPTQSIFNEKVAFPALEGLYIDSVPNITVLWDKNLLSTESFRLPRSLKVWDCEKLVKFCDEKPMNILPLLRNIQELTVEKCPDVEAIVFLEEKEEETQEAINKDVILFPELTFLQLQKLETLKGICAYKSKDQLYFNVQVAFPNLDTNNRSCFVLDGHSKKIFTKATSNKKVPK